MSSSDTYLGRGILRPVLIDHACGHRHAHMVPLFAAGSEDLFVTVDIIASQPCPACLLAEHGLPPILPERRAGIHAV